MNVHARPEAGKANVEIMKYFKKEYKLNIEIISGFTSREKLVKKFNSLNWDPDKSQLII
jgi:uncharacterized protein (TIGR00251 family)